MIDSLRNLIDRKLANVHQLYKELLSKQRQDNKIFEALQLMYMAQYIF